MPGARRALLERLIDHAALFPPASMSMPDALAEDRRVRSGEAAWLVNRFVCPASRLGELGPAPLRLSVILDAPTPLDDPRIEAIELPPQAAAAVAHASEVYEELPLDGDVRQRVATLAAGGRRAKVRCGGAVVPSVEALAEFVRRCREARVRFKATAGLHHPIRVDGSHGFLNLVAAALFGDEEAALADDEPDAFRLTDEGFFWRGRGASAADVARVRREGLVALGSCSVQEPVDELKALGIAVG
jgi:hypothetical protein